MSCEAGSASTDPEPATVQNAKLPSPHPADAAPGPRATHLINLINTTLSHTLKTISYGNFAQCFPTPAEHAEGSLQSLHGHFIQRLEDLAKAEFDEILKERNVIENLNSLDELILAAKRRKARATEGDEPPIPPHTLPPATLVAAHLAPALQQHQSQLNARLQTTQAQNAVLFETVKTQRAEIDGLVKRLEDIVKDLEGAVDVVTVERDEVAKEVREMEGEMKRVENN